jgi:predicted AAA+ superfamily ATPase
MDGALSTVLARDVIQGGIRNIRDFRRLFRHIALHPGGKFEPFGIGKDFGGVDGREIRNWNQILEDVMLVQPLEALKPNLGPHRGADKIYVTDPAWISLFREFTEEALEPDDPLLGLIVESILIDHARRIRFNVHGTTALPIGYVDRPEVDLALDLGPRWLFLESKYSNQPRVQLADIGPDDAIRIITTRDRFEEGEGRIPHFVPAEEFALIC